MIMHGGNIVLPQTMYQAINNVIPKPEQEGREGNTLSINL